MITHVDADHIGGICERLLDAAPGVTFGDVWFTGWQHLPGTPATVSPLQSEPLSGQLHFP
ncbi:MAG: hypothetical protein CYG59_20355 [Chloroflexi bacterium]|nr:MAG: hypothetical protein CYG59_20355 [Chloroflexota bacterium]